MPKKKAPQNKTLGSVLHIYCEGEKTEPNYIQSYIDRNYPGNRSVSRAVKIEDTRKNTPKQLVDVAVRHKKQPHCPEGDVFWVVYDRESTIKYPDALHADASKKAKDNGVNVALSNICFELWLLLHFRRNAASYSSYSDLIANSPLRDELQKMGIHSYEKGDRIFSRIQGGVSEARERAATMNAETKRLAANAEAKPHQLNPYTELGVLLDAIDNFVIDNKYV